MKDTIWWICLSTSVSFIFAVGRWTRRVAIDRGFNHTRGGELIGARAKTYQTYSKRNAFLNC
jgi:threonine/homoserine/homoserine lactone efflux protein